MTPHLTLRFPTVDDRARCLELDAAFVPEGFDFLAGHCPVTDGNAEESWRGFLATVRREHEGADLSPDRVPADFLLAVLEDGEIVGRTSVRYGLNDFLLNYGGHIGYAVAPEFRRRGYATEILRQSLALLAGRGVDRALVTCDDDNTGSYRTIGNNGGVLENRSTRPDGTLIRRYWIDLPRP